MAQHLKALAGYSCRHEFGSLAPTSGPSQPPVIQLQTSMDSRTNLYTERDTYTELRIK